jgi:L-asparagine permease
LIAVILVLGWFGVRKRVSEEALKEHDHHHDGEEDVSRTLAEDAPR